MRMTMRFGLVAALLCAAVFGGMTRAELPLVDPVGVGVGGGGAGNDPPAAPVIPASVSFEWGPPENLFWWSRSFGNGAFGNGAWWWTSQSQDGSSGFITMRKGQAAGTYEVSAFVLGSDGRGFMAGFQPWVPGNSLYAGREVTPGSGMVAMRCYISIGNPNNVPPPWPAE